MSEVPVAMTMASILFWCMRAAGAVEALLALGEGDGDGFVAAAGEGGDGGRKIVGLAGLRGESEGGSCCDCRGGNEETAAVDV